MNLAGLQGAAHGARTREMKLLRGRPAPHMKAPSEVHFAAFHVAADVHGAGAMNLLGLQAAVHLHGPCGVELARMGVPLEHAGPRDLHERGVQVADDTARARALKLPRPDRVPGHDSAARNLHHAVRRHDALAEVGELHSPQSGVEGLLETQPDLREIPQGRLEGLPNRPFDEHAHVVRSARGATGRLFPRRHIFCLLLSGLRLVPGFDLEVRLLGDLAPREPLLEPAEDVRPLHRSTTLYGVRTSMSR